MPEAATVLLVHGAFHGSWCWEAVRAELRGAGVPTAVVDNPSVTAPGSDLAADGDNVRRVLDTIDGPVVLVGHSYGGAVIGDAGAHPNVEHLVFVTALVLDTGESAAVNALTGGEGSALADAMEFDGGMTTIAPARAVDLFFHDCTGRRRGRRRAAASDDDGGHDRAVAGSRVAGATVDVRRVHR